MRFRSLIGLRFRHDLQGSFKKTEEFDGDFDKDLEKKVESRIRLKVNTTNGMILALIQGPGSVAEYSRKPKFSSLIEMLTRGI